MKYLVDFNKFLAIIDFFSRSTYRKSERRTRSWPMVNFELEEDRITHRKEAIINHL